MFALDNGGDLRDNYIVGHTSLAGRVLFTDSPVGTPEAAFMKRNDPLGNPGEIESLVEQGYMVRTRADADTVQARSGDTTQRDAALASGAHFISTDYPVPDPDFSDYQVRLPGDGIARCNPVAPGTARRICYKRHGTGPSTPCTGLCKEHLGACDDQDNGKDVFNAV